MDMNMVSPRKRIDMEGSGPRRRMACGGESKPYAKGGAVRGDGICVKGRTRGRMV